MKRIDIATTWIASSLMLSVPTGACSSSSEPPKTTACSLVDETGCPTGQVCEQVGDGGAQCFAPVSIEGRVVSTTDGAGVTGALVVARDANGAAISSVAVTQADGSYSLSVPVPRDENGRPVGMAYCTLRADATGYLSFPAPPREAIPVDMGTATGDPWVVRSAATEIGLIPLPDSTGRGTIQGKVVSEHPGGTLIVAGGATAVADRDGNFTVVNVPAGPAEVKAYQVGLELSSTQITVAANATQSGVTLSSTGQATATVQGTIQIVNASGTSKTSVILVVEDTFNESVIRGEAPPGLRAGDVSGTWSIAGVPVGKYVALAAFENDGLVRDPDTSIGGTQIQHITVAGNVEVPGFKVTEALAVLSPGANGPEATNGTPTFQWVDDSSEDSYDVKLLDALGKTVWTTDAKGPKGNAPVSVAYAGPELTRGMYYQFKATSIKDGIPISTTEDLKGVFFVQ